ncbi:MAG: sigma 54-interacting transcriptional regulator [Lentisphaeraceae bacterium]|nr:sigma 54-interacting transcriptional regulator [Lentisphaeraceae bacterium]
MKKKLNLLGELIEDFTDVKTHDSLVKNLADYMHRNFKAAAVEMAWNIGASTTVYNVTRDNDSYTFKKTGRDLNQSAFSEVLASGQALVSEVQDETDDSLFIEERIAIELYATQLVILPLYENDDINGFVSFYLLEEQDLAGLSELLQHMLSTITLLIKQIDLVGRLTSVSRKAYKKVRQYTETLEENLWHGESEKVGQIRQELLQDCRLAAKSSTTVYLRGEEGTNKDEVAEIIHRFRTYGKESFVEFDCSKLKDEKQAALLFGTKSNDSKQGYWDRAGQGTLYISNADEMVPESQEILAELIELEDSNTPQIIISGDLEKAVNDSDFDSEILEEVSALTIEVAPLRECREDILNIAKRYLKELSQSMKLPTPKMDRKFTQAIVSNSWKDNHKEFRSFLEKAIISSPDKNLVIPTGFDQEGSITIIRTTDSLESSIKSNIIDALKKTRGKVYGEDGAAVLLGLNPSTLQSKIRKFGIKKKTFKKL